MPPRTTDPWAVLFPLGWKLLCGSPGSAPTVWARCGLLGAAVRLAPRSTVRPPNAPAATTYHPHLWNQQD